VDGTLLGSARVDKYCISVLCRAEVGELGYGTYRYLGSSRNNEPRKVVTVIKCRHETFRTKLDLARPRNPPRLVGICRNSGLDTVQECWLAQPQGAGLMCAFPHDDFPSHFNLSCLLTVCCALCCTVQVVSLIPAARFTIRPSAKAADMTRQAMVPPLRQRGTFAFRSSPLNMQ
jgi:hypothetical protein